MLLLTPARPGASGPGSVPETVEGRTELARGAQRGDGGGHRAGVRLSSKPGAVSGRSSDRERCGVQPERNRSANGAGVLAAADRAAVLCPGFGGEASRRRGASARPRHAVPRRPSSPLPRLRQAMGSHARLVAIEHDQRCSSRPLPLDNSTSATRRREVDDVGSRISRFVPTLRPRSGGFAGSMQTLDPRDLRQELTSSISALTRDGHCSGSIRRSVAAVRAVERPTVGPSTA